MKEQILHKTKWLSLRKLIDPENGVHGYDFVHEDRCNGKIISILPYKFNKEGKIEFLLRDEVTPCWGMKSVTSSITGGVEERVITTVVHELEEEAGYEVSTNDLVFLNTVRGTKSSDTVYYLYTVDLTKKEKTLDASGDGSELEKMAECYWDTKIDDAIDPLVYVLYYRVMKYLHLNKS